MQNGYIESFNGKFRDECLNDRWFAALLRSANRPAPFAAFAARIKRSLAGVPPSR